MDEKRIEVIKNDLIHMFKKQIDDLMSEIENPNYEDIYLISLSENRDLALRFVIDNRKNKKYFILEYEQAYSLFEGDIEDSYSGSYKEFKDCKEKLIIAFKKVLNLE